MKLPRLGYQELRSLLGVYSKVPVPNKKQQLSLPILELVALFFLLRVFLNLGSESLNQRFSAQVAR